MSSRPGGDSPSGNRGGNGPVLDAIGRLGRIVGRLGRTVGRLDRTMSQVVRHLDRLDQSVTRRFARLTTLTQMANRARRNDHDQLEARVSRLERRARG